MLGIIIVTIIVIALVGGGVLIAAKNPNAASSFAGVVGNIATAIKGLFSKKS